MASQGLLSWGDTKLVHIQRFLGAERVLMRTVNCVLGYKS